jgi:hypothetical protein
MFIERIFSGFNSLVPEKNWHISTSKIVFITFAVYQINFLCR